MMNIKRFLAAALLALLAAGGALAQNLTILHTNDTHSHIDPLRSGEESGLGGVIERAAYIDSVRSAVGKRNMLLVDAGDFSQGSSYFTMLHGDLEVDLINAMRYDAVCLGNHEFDNGLEELERRVKKLRCPVVCANYEFRDSDLSRLVKPYAIIRRGGFKIGFIGLLTDLTRVVDRPIADRISYLDPIEVTNRYADYLKNVKHCDLVICLSHLGYEKASFTDRNLVAGTRNVDVVIGGHSHTFLETEKVHENMDGDPVTVVTDGCWGLYVGKLEVTAGGGDRVSPVGSGC